MPSTDVLSLKADGRRSLSASQFSAEAWNTNSSRSSIAESDIQGEHALDQTAMTHRVFALRQMNGGTSKTIQHRNTKGNGAQSSTFSRPVIVRTYSGAKSSLKSTERPVYTSTTLFDGNNGKVEMPPLEAFTFKGIMDSIQSSVSEDLDRIAEICARSRYSLSNQYEVHMPPHGMGDGYHVQIVQVEGLTLQASVDSDDEPLRSIKRKTPRRVKSIAQGTLETIMSSSRSSEEEKASKASAAELAGNIKVRMASQMEATSSMHQFGISSARHIPSAAFTSMNVGPNYGPEQVSPPIMLLSHPANPETTTFVGQKVELANSPLQSQLGSSTPVKSTPTSLLNSLNLWLSWRSRDETSGSATLNGRFCSSSVAEGSLKGLLKGAHVDRKGKNVDRG